MSYNEAQKKRFKDHAPTVIATDGGGLHFTTENIITPKGLSKKNKLITVIPNENETIETIAKASDVFTDLKQMNVILTNACNLSCSYCYEQHNKDFGRFTPDSLIKIYRFLVNSNKRQKKVFQFFGGEPLIHKDLILNFLRDNQTELEENARGDSSTAVGIVTNGLLLTDELINEYFSYDFTWMLISLDTDRSEVDHREIGQEKIDKLMDQIERMPAGPKSEQRVTIRCTLARENAPYFMEFIDNLYARGIRRMVVHPLILDSARGFIQWSQDEWSGLHQDILTALEKYHDLQIHFSEGVGQKGDENCMVGADMIAIDGSGDFSGCYFFTNQKSNGTGHTILGNILQDKIYIDRYKDFQKEYAKMFEEEEQCRSCNYKNACYQCPAGNLDTGSKMFRPDDMCQNIVKLYVDLQEDIAKKQFKLKYNIITESMGIEGENTVFTKAIMYLIFFYMFNYHPKDNMLVHAKHENVDDYRKLLFLFKNIINKEIQIDCTPETFVDIIQKNIPEEIEEVDDFYYFVLDRGQIIPTKNKKKAQNEYQRAFYLTLLHLIILQSEHKTFESTFNERVKSS